MLLRQIRNALITAFILSLALTSMSFALANHAERLEVNTQIVEEGPAEGPR